MLDYVEAHLSEDLSLVALADIACLSPFHFSRCFKQAMCIGPRRYVLQRQVERAKEMIARTNQPLAAVAQAAGCARVHWLTHETNTDAMLLYDRVAVRSGFVQYRQILS